MLEPKNEVEALALEAWMRLVEEAARLRSVETARYVEALAEWQAKGMQRRQAPRRPRQPLHRRKRTMSDEDKAYVGFTSCGCAVAAMVAGYESERSEKAQLKRWAKQGYRIEVMTSAEARKQQGFLGCIHADDKHEATEENAIDALVAKARDPQLGLVR